VALTAPEVPHLAGRDAALRELGYRDWEAAWIALVCLHSGVFTRTQCIKHHHCSPETVRSLVRRLVHDRVARELPLPDMDTKLRYTHLHSRSLYGALGNENIRHRKKTRPIHLFRRLLSLDHVIRHPDLPWLATEQEKVDHFTGRGIRREDLPSQLYGRGDNRTRRYFVQKLPIAADEKSATFVYVDPGRRTDKELRGWRAEHDALWRRLRALGTEVYVAGVARTVAAQHALSRKLAAWQNAPAAAEPLTPEERETMAAIKAAILSKDRAAFARWGGLNPARRMAISLRKRADLEDSGGASGAPIDGYSTHHAHGLAPQALA